MYKETVRVVNKAGFHARPASALAMKARDFKSDIIIRNLDAKPPKDIDAKLVMRLMASDIPCGAQIEIEANGTDEQAAVEALAELVAASFGEV